MAAISETAGPGVAEHGLKRELRLRDLVPMQILLMVGVSWAGIAAKQGSTHPTIWIFGILIFFLPQAAVVTYCARLWPIEGGVYQWAKFALGPLAGVSECMELRAVRGADSIRSGHSHRDRPELCAGTRCGVDGGEPAFDLRV